MGLGMLVHYIEELMSSKLPINTQDYQMAELKQAKRSLSPTTTELWNSLIQDVMNTRSPGG